MVTVQLLKNKNGVGDVKTALIVSILIVVGFLLAKWNPFFLFGFFLLMLILFSKLSKPAEIVGSMSFEMDQIRINTFTDEMVIPSKDFVHIKFVYSGYKDKNLVVDTRRFSGTDNFINFRYNNSNYSYKFKVENEGVEALLFEQIARWKHFGFDVDHFKIIDA